MKVLGTFQCVDCAQLSPRTGRRQLRCTACVRKEDARRVKAAYVPRPRREKLVLPCRDCGGTPRATKSARCAVCLRAHEAKQMRERRQASPGSDAAYQRLRYAANPEKGVARSAAYYWKDPETARSKARSRYAANPEPGREYAVRYYHANREELARVAKLWREANPTKVKAVHHTRRSRLKQAEGTWTPAELLSVFEAYGFVCPHCGSKDSPSVDHIVPIAWGGNNCVWNLALLCTPCNVSKGARWLSEFLPWNGIAPRPVLLVRLGQPPRRKKPHEAKQHDLAGHNPDTHGILVSEVDEDVEIRASGTG